MSDQAIVDTSVLIALEKINTVNVLCKIYSSIILPEAVASEFGPPSIDCYSVEKVKSPMVRLLVRDLNLGKGEAVQNAEYAENYRAGQDHRNRVTVLQQKIKQEAGENESHCAPNPHPWIGRRSFAPAPAVFRPRKEKTILERNHGDETSQASEPSASI